MMVFSIYFTHIFGDYPQVDILHHPSTEEGALDVFVKVFTGEPGL
jgi:hypothetical protein